MKVIKYQYVSAEINHGTEEQPKIEQILFEKSIPWNEANEETAKRESYNGDYTIEWDGQAEPETASTDDVLNALLGVTV